MDEEGGRLHPESTSWLTTLIEKSFFSEIAFTLWLPQEHSITSTTWRSRYLVILNSFISFPKWRKIVANPVNISALPSSMPAFCYFLPNTDCISTYVLTLCLQWKRSLWSGPRWIRKYCCIIILVHLRDAHGRFVWNVPISVLQFGLWNIC